MSHFLRGDLSLSNYKVIKVIRFGRARQQINFEHHKLLSRVQCALKSEEIAIWSTFCLKAKSLKSIFWYMRNKKGQEKWRKTSKKNVILLICFRVSIFNTLWNHPFVITRLHFPISRVPNHTRLEESKNFEIKSQYFIIVVRSTTTAPKEKCVFKENICTFSFPSKNINYNFISGISQYIYRIPLKKNFNYYNTIIWFFARISKDLSRYGFYQLKMQLRVHNGMISWVILSFTVLSEKKHYWMRSSNLYFTMSAKRPIIYICW